MGLYGWIKGFFVKERLIKALIIYPNKEMIMQTVNIINPEFKLAERTYIVDERAIYYFGKKPLLMYHFDNPSPIIISQDRFDFSMRSEEINSVLESRAIKDLLTAAGEGQGWLFWICVAGAVFSLLNFLMLGGWLKLGKVTATP